MSFISCEMGWGDKHKMCEGEYLTGGSHGLFQDSVMVIAHLTPKKPEKVSFPVPIT